MNRVGLTLLVFFSLLFLVPSQSTHAGSRKMEKHEEVASVLDAFHQAAAQANGKKYFSLFAKGGIFLGTDATEKWTVEQFKKYAAPHFSKGKGWKYIPSNRQIYFSPDGNSAWFDELLSNEKLGQCRGTGVLTKEEGKWRIAQYHLTIPIPNELALEFAEKIQKTSKAPKSGGR